MIITPLKRPPAPGGHRSGHRAAPARGPSSSAQISRSWRRTSPASCSPWQPIGRRIAVYISSQGGMSKRVTRFTTCSVRHPAGADRGDRVRQRGRADLCRGPARPAFAPRIPSCCISRPAGRRDGERHRNRGPRFFACDRLRRISRARPVSRWSGSRRTPTAISGSMRNRR